MNQVRLIYILGIVVILILAAIDCYDIYKVRSNLNAFIPYIVSGIYLLFTIVYWFILKKVVHIEQQSGKNLIDFPIQKSLNRTLIAAVGTTLIVIGSEYLEQLDLLDWSRNEMSFSLAGFASLYFILIGFIVAYIFYSVQVGHHLNKIENPFIDNLNDFGFALKIFSPIGVSLGFFSAFTQVSFLEYIGFILVLIPNFILLGIFWNLLRNATKFQVQPTVKSTPQSIDPLEEFPNAD